MVDTFVERVDSASRNRFATTKCGESRPPRHFHYLKGHYLAAVWIAWRHNFSGTGLLLAVPAFFGGGLFLTIYLLIASFAAKGAAATLLLGLSVSLRTAARPLHSALAARVLISIPIGDGPCSNR